LTRVPRGHKVVPHVGAKSAAQPEEDYMSDRVQKVDYFYVTVPNSAGQAAKVLSGLAAQGVNLLAFSGFPSDGRGQLDLVPESTPQLKRAAKKLKLKLSKRKSAFLLQGSDRVGAISKTLNTLAAAKINITALDAVAGGGRFAAIFWVRPKKVAKAAKLLRAK
jgi:prephenate dehydratase